MNDAPTCSRHGLLNLLHHFKQRKLHRHTKTWFQARRNAVTDEVTVYRSRCDYILHSDRRLFQTVGIRTPFKFDTDHLMLVARFLVKPTRHHKAYLLGRKKFPLRPIHPLSQADILFQAVKAQMPIELPQLQRSRPNWISARTLVLMDR